MNDLITAGVLAKLAGTTKRTIQFYDRKGVLKPVATSGSKYRLYEERQVLDYQKILLLSSHGVSLSEIGTYLKNKGDLTSLYEEKKEVIREEIIRLEFNLKNIEEYTANLKKTGTMVDPKIRVMKPFDVYYIRRVGAYAQIDSFCRELKGMFVKPGKGFTTLSIFEDQGYRPKESHILISAFAAKGMVVKEEFKDTVKRMTYDPGKVISYMYHGPGEMLSLFWKELEKYCRLHQITVRTDVPDFEIYWKVSNDPTKQRFEILLPVV